MLNISPILLNWCFYMAISSLIWNLKGFYLKGLGSGSVTTGCQHTEYISHITEGEGGGLEFHETRQFLLISFPSSAG